MAEVCTVLKSQTMQQEALAFEARLNELASEIETRGVDDEAHETRMNERATLWPQLIAKQKEVIEQLKVEDAEAQAAMAKNADTSGWTAEMREFHELGQRTSMEAYAMAGFQQRQLTPGTPEHDYNTHVFGGQWNIGEYPLEMLLNRQEYFSLEAWQMQQTMESDMEQRTEITGVVGTAGNLSFVDRIFADSEGAYCRAVYPAVGPGRHSYPSVTGTGNVGAVIARGTAETVAGGLTVISADPERIQHSFEVARSDELQMPGVMAYLVNDIREGLIAGLDNKVIDDLYAGLTEVDFTNDTTVTLATFMAAWASGVNGIRARYFEEARVLLAAVPESMMTNDLYSTAMGFLGTATGGAFAALSGPNCRASAHLPAASADDESRMIVIGMAPAAPRLIVPTWRRAEILRDSGRLQLQGAVTLTGAMYADVILARDDMHVRNLIDTA